MKYIIFQNDDETYLNWVATHPKGFVLNIRKSETPDFMALHKATCRDIQNLNRNAGDGGFTQRGYFKVCAENINDLKEYARKYGRPDGSFSKECGHCKP